MCLKSGCSALLPVMKKPASGLLPSDLTVGEVEILGSCSVLGGSVTILKISQPNLLWKIGFHSVALTRPLLLAGC